MMIKNIVSLHSQPNCLTTQTSYTDHELFQQIATGNETAFEQLIKKYGPLLEQAILQVIQTETAVKDILQDVFLHLWLDRERLASIEVPRTWIFRIAYYRSYTWLKHHGVRKRVHNMLQSQQSTLSDQYEVEEYTSFKATKQYLHEAIEQLTPQAKRMYLLSRENNLKVEEIAQQLGLSAQTVKNTLTTALKQIRKFLQEKGVYLPAILFFLKEY